MALTVHPPASLPTKMIHLPFHRPFFFCYTKPTYLTIKSQDSSSESSQPAIISGQPTDDTSSAVAPTTTTKKPNSKGLGFGLSSSPAGKSSTNPSASKKKQKGKRERASIIRRAAVEKPKLFSQQEEVQDRELSKNDGAFLLAWLALGAVILIEGIVLAASGFLPEEWDNFFVKYLYPSFTPTVFLFVAGTVAFGVLKYLQNEKIKNE